MTHEHDIKSVYASFIIDPNDRGIYKQSPEKIVIIQGDHNSKRFGFRIPRYIEKHDTALCDKIKVHYINISSDKTKRSEDIYSVKDMKIDKTDENFVVFSWKISRNATKYEGILSFLIEFLCLDGDEITYAWNTNKHIESIGEGMNNSEAVTKEFSDVLAAWESEAIKNVTDKAIEAANEIFVKKVEELEDADAENKKAIEDHVEAYNTKVEELEDADAENKKAIEDHVEAYNTKVEELEGADAENKKAIEDHVKAYNAKVEELERQAVNSSTTAANAHVIANAAQTAADNAIEASNLAQNAANNAQETANNAVEIANAAQETANNAVEATNTAQNAANNAQETANNAVEIANAAQTVANNAVEATNLVQNAANNAQETANNAIEIANEAQETANNAVEATNTAQNAANNAQESANNAVEVANAASSNASEALTKANTASATATEAKNMVIGKVSTSDIVNNLNSTDANKPLSALQGKILGDSLKDANENALSANTLATNANTTAINTHNELQKFKETINEILKSDDVTLDQVQEIVDYIKNNKDLIEGITTTKVNVADIIDSLDSTETKKPLSANQGAVLKGYIVDISNAIDSFLEEELPNRLAKTEEDIKKVDTKLNERTKYWYAMSMEQETIFSANVEQGHHTINVGELPDVLQNVDVTYDEVKQTFVVKSMLYYDKEAKFVGNASIYNSELEDTKEDFLVLNIIGRTTAQIYIKSSGSHTIKVETSITQVGEEWVRDVEVSGNYVSTTIETDILPKAGDLVRVIQDGKIYDARLYQEAWTDTGSYTEYVLLPDEIVANVTSLGFAFVYYEGQKKFIIEQLESGTHVYSILQLIEPKTLPKEYLPMAWIAEPSIPITVLNNSVINGWSSELTAPFEFADGMPISVIRDGISYDGTLVYSEEGLGDFTNILLCPFTSPEGEMFAVGAFPNTNYFAIAQEGEHTYSVSVTKPIEKLPEEYLPIDTELDKESNRPVANSFFAKLFDFGEVQQSSGSLIALVDGVLKAMKFGNGNAPFSVIVRDSGNHASINPPRTGYAGGYDIANRVYVDNKAGGSTSISISKNTSKVITLSCTDHEGTRTDVPRGLYNGTGIYILYSNSAGEIEIIPEDDATVTIKGKFVILSVTPHSTTDRGIRCCALYYNDLIDFGWKTAYTVLGKTITFKASSGADLMVQYHQISPFRAKFPS